MKEQMAMATERINNPKTHTAYREKKGKSKSGKKGHILGSYKMKK